MLQKLSTPAERLVVAADFKPRPIMGNGAADVRSQVLTLADKLNGTGIFLKVNSALRACGYGLINEIRSRGLKVFADLKLFDIGETLSTDGALLGEARPELLTVACVAGVDGMRGLKATLPYTEILGVTVLTNLNDVDCIEIFACRVEESVERLAVTAVEAGIDGLVLSAKEVERFQVEFGDVLSFNTPGIRPSWSIVPGDDQNPERVMTPAKAIQAGVDRIIVGRPITQAKSPYDAVMRTIEEIASATA